MVATKCSGLQDVLEQLARADRRMRASSCDRWAPCWTQRVAGWSAPARP